MSLVFVIAVEGLSLMLECVVLRSVLLFSTEPIYVSHLVFTDNLMIFCLAKRDTLTNQSGALYWAFDLSGLKGQSHKEQNLLWG